MHDTPSLLHKTPDVPLRLGIIGTYEAPQGKDYPPHQHNTWELVYYRAGHIQCPLGDQIYEGRPGVLLCTPPGVFHSEKAWTAYAHTSIAVAAPADHPWPRMVLDDPERTFGSLFGTFLSEWRGQALNRDEMLDLLLQQLDIRLRRTQEQRQPSEAEQLVREVEQILEERFATPLTIQAIAKEVGLSPSALRAHFARLRGKTPMEHLQAVRVRHALALLRNSSLTLEAIANVCGYDSASHLSRHVKQATGKSPGSLRNR